MQDKQRNLKVIIEKQTKFVLSTMVDKIRLKQATFPLLPITYTLWRSSAYDLVYSKIQQYPKCTLQQLNNAFFQVSEQSILDNFIAKIQRQMNIYCRGLKDIKEKYKGVQKFQKQQQQAYALVLLLGEKVWYQQLYLQLLIDLLQLPYINIFSPKVSLIVRQQYKTGYSRDSQNKPKVVEKIYNKVGETFVSKTVQSITQLLFSKRLVFQINTLIGNFNPILMGASYGLSTFMKYRQQKIQSQKLIDQISQALKFSTEKVQILKNIYQKIKNILKCLLSGVLQQQEKVQQIKKIKQMFLRIFEEEWLSIQELGIDQDGFQIVNLQERDSFQQLG